VNLSVLDIFILSMLDRGAKSAYDLQRRAGVSLGASTPSLAKLLQNELVTSKEGRSPTNHRRFVFALTDSGREQARTGWHSWFADDNGITDLDSLLRVADMASHYGAEPARVKRLLRRAAETRLQMARQAKDAVGALPGSTKLLYRSMRTRCDEKRLRAEADALLQIANDIKRPTGVHPGQQPLL
jgi:DNA-binding PadR family transcriptional regulator